MVKIVLMILYLLIGLFFVGSVIGKSIEKLENENDATQKKIILIASLVVSVLELFAWPAMIAITAGIVAISGQKKDD